MRRIGELMLIMLKIGLFTFGGGYAMIALLERELVARREWIEREEFLDMVALSESTPGPIAINAATYIGYRRAGAIGAVAATVSVCIPSFVIIFLISCFFDLFLSLEVVAKAFLGIRVCVVWLVLSAGLRLLRGMKKTPLSVTLLCTVCGLMVLFSVLSISFSSVIYVLAAGVVGLAASFLRKMKERREEKA